MPYYKASNQWAPRSKPPPRRVRLTWATTYDKGQVIHLIDNLDIGCEQSVMRAYHIYFSVSGLWKAGHSGADDRLGSGSGPQ
jgi:hypothetical protein